MQTFQNILTFLESIAATISITGIPGAAGGAKLADILLKIAQAAIAAHEAVKGQPLDLNQLKDIDKV